MLQDQNHFSMWCFFWYIWDFSEISNLADHEYGTISEKANLIWARSSYTTNLKRLSIKRKPCNWCRTAAHCLWPQSQSHIRILQKWKIQWWLSPISHAHIFSFLNLNLLSSAHCTYLKSSALYEIGTDICSLLLRKTHSELTRNDVVAANCPCQLSPQLD